jgi:hypothetical protein
MYVGGEEAGELDGYLPRYLPKYLPKYILLFPPVPVHLSFDAVMGSRSGYDKPNRCFTSFVPINSPLSRLPPPRTGIKLEFLNGPPR